MKYPLYSVRDRHTGFGTITTDYNDFTAKRNFAQAINTGTGSMSYEPGDYDLYKVGEFDTDTGVIMPENIPVLVVSGLAVYGAKND